MPRGWDYHVSLALGITNEENLDGIGASIEHAVACGKEAMLDCEHFFDGYKANPDYAVACAKAAFDGGARWVVLCDTNGGTQPSEVERIVRAVIDAGIPGDRLGIHAHNDTGQAVANSLAAVDAGVRQIQGTLNGIGERCGNANLVTLIPTLMLKPVWNDRFETSISEDKLPDLTRLSHAFDELLNRPPEAQNPYVGASAFATKAGIHASALLKDPKTYEHVPAESVGNQRKVMVSNQGGKSNFINELKRRGIEVAKDNPKLDRLIERVKEKEAKGYSYEAADASFEIMARQVLDRVPEFFKVESFRVMVERRYDAMGNLKTVSEAIVRVEVDGEKKMSVAEGHGPVNALDIALRKDLGKVSGGDRGSGTHGLQGADPQWWHRGHHTSADRITRHHGRAMVDGGCVRQHHRCLVSGDDGFGDLQIVEGAYHLATVWPVAGGRFDLPLT